MESFGGNMRTMNEMNTEKLVSIITPSYNSEDLIIDTIESVQNQEYTNWEMIIVDDCSSDKTPELIREKMKEDNRIQLHVLENNSGAAIARNTAIEQAKGHYLAFLDSDDLWDASKLRKQVAFMEDNDYVFTSTSFKEINENNEYNGNVTKSHERLDYDGILRYCPGNSTVMYNVDKLGKFYIPDIKKRNDFVMWLQVIKQADYLYGIEEALTSYRIRENSLSSNKTDLVKYQWRVYRDIEKLSLPKSLFLLTDKVLQILRKRSK